MINIKILCVGKVREKSLQDLINEYVKRLTKFCKLEIIEIEDEKIPYSFSVADAEKIKEKESNKILDKLSKIGKCDVILMDLNGKQYTSEEFSKKISKMCTYGSSTLVFIIGGSLGMSEHLLSIPSDKISFSKMTFPHQLMRVILTEQIYRAYRIINKEPYHK